MHEDTQKYSNSTVYIVIAFLAIFIIMPPLCRTLYAEEEPTDEIAPVIEDAVSTGKLICSKSFEATGMEIISTATYKDSSIISNVIVLKNPNFLTTNVGLNEAAQKEFNEFNSLYSSFSNIPDTNKVVSGDSTTITIDQNILDVLGDNEEISSQMQDSLTLQNSFEVNGYSCITE